MACDHKASARDGENSLETVPPLHGERDPLLGSKISEKHRRAGRLQIAALCWSLFVLGWSDGSFGPLLPRMLRTYNVGYETVSWTFVFTCMGVFLGAITNMPLNDRFGYGKIIVIGSVLQSTCFIMQAFASSFPMFVAAFFIGGIGMAIEDAQANGYVAMLRHDGEWKMGLLQASYGLGALLSPLSATQFSQMTHWSFHFLISFALSITNSLALVAIFRFRGQDECLRKSGEVVPETVQSVGNNKYGQMLRLKAVHLLALFLIVYIGVEVTIGGWIVTFMINVRGGGPSSGYIASGFFGGLTLGRVILIWVTQKVGELRVVYLYMSLVILLQFVVWLVPSITIGSIAVFFIGLFLGPLCPIALRHAARVIPRPLVTGSIGYIAAYGAAGSALLPSLTGFLAENYGILSLQPFLIVMMVLMGLIWVMVPTTPAEGEER